MYRNPVILTADILAVIQGSLFNTSFSHTTKVGLPHLSNPSLTTGLGTAASGYRWVGSIMPAYGLGCPGSHSPRFCYVHPSVAFCVIWWKSADCSCGWFAEALCPGYVNEPVWNVALHKSGGRAQAWLTAELSNKKSCVCLLVWPITLRVFASRSSGPHLRFTAAAWVQKHSDCACFCGENVVFVQIIKVGLVISVLFPVLMNHYCCLTVCVWQCA